MGEVPASEGVDVPRGDARGRLRSLLAISAAVNAVGNLLDLLEIIADEACGAVGASSLAISQVTPDRSGVQTLINVGDLAAGEERRPAAEFYSFADFPAFEAHLASGRPYRTSVDDPSSPPAAVAMLHRLGKRASITIPITVGDRVWGELWVSHVESDPDWTDVDIAFLHGVAAHIAAAITKAEQLEQLSTYAYTDDLTGLVNRRRLYERLTALLEDPAAAPVTVAMCDVDGLKRVNDAFGHEAGDELLRRAGAALGVLARDPHVTVGRTGGDEFCVVFAQCDAAGAAKLVRGVVAPLSSGTEPVLLSAGISSTTAGHRDPTNLLRAADIALYTAKHRCPGAVVVSDPGNVEHPPGVDGLEPGERRERRGRREGLVERFLLAVRDAADVPGDADHEKRAQRIVEALASVTGGRATLRRCDDGLDGAPANPASQTGIRLVHGPTPMIVGMVPGGSACYLLTVAGVEPFDVTPALCTAVELALTAALR